MPNHRRPTAPQRPVVALVNHKGGSSDEYTRRRMSGIRAALTDALIAQVGPPTLLNVDSSIRRRQT